MARVRGISVVEMARIIEEKAVKAIIKCEEPEDLAKKKIKGIKNQEELQSFLNNFKEQVKDSLTNL